MESILWNILLLIIISLISLIYWYFTRNYNYWSKRGINGPKPKPGVGNMLDQFISSEHSLDLAYVKKYGKIFGTYSGNQPVLVVAEPDLIKSILVKDFNHFADRTPYVSSHPIFSKNLATARGEDWKRIRSIVSPTFTSGKMKKMYPLIKDCLTEFLGSVEEQTKNGKCDVNVKDMFGKYTMDVITTCAFATKINAYKDQNNPFIVNALKVLHPSVWRLAFSVKLPGPLKKVLNLNSPHDESSSEFFIQLTRHIINDRKNNNKKSNDFIQLLLNEQNDCKQREQEVVKDVNDSNESHHINEGEEELKLQKNLFSNMSDKYITEDEILAQAWIFLIAGYETTASTLTYASYELALNHDIQQRLYEEVLTAVDANGNIDYDLLSKLLFLDCVISETLRHYAPGINLFRMATADYKLGLNGIKICKGDVVQIPVYAVHHLDEFYPEPFKFNPDRFMPENRHKIIPYTYVPFGGGPRNCIGMRFALMEAKVGLAQLIKRFKLSKSPQTDSPLKQKVYLNLNIVKSLIVCVEKRL